MRACAPAPWPTWAARRRTPGALCRAGPGPVGRLPRVQPPGRERIAGQGTGTVAAWTDPPAADRLPNQREAGRGVAGAMKDSGARLLGSVLSCAGCAARGLEHLSLARVRGPGEDRWGSLGRADAAIAAAGQAGAELGHRRDGVVPPLLKRLERRYDKLALDALDHHHGLPPLPTGRWAAGHGFPAIIWLCGYDGDEPSCCIS